MSSNKEIDCFGYDNFLQVNGTLRGWKNVLEHDKKVLKLAILRSGRDKAGNPVCDRIGVNDAATAMKDKVEEIAQCAKDQVEEYKSFCDILTTWEEPLPQVSMSGRGRRLTAEEEDDDILGGDEAAEQEENLLSRLIAGASPYLDLNCLGASCSDSK